MSDEQTISFLLIEDDRKESRAIQQTLDRAEYRGFELEWVQDLSSGIERLEEKGHELRRPEADYLRDKIHELRAALNGIRYRMLYFFYKKQGVITHGITKKGGKVPSGEIELAITRKARFEKEPMKHTLKKGASHGEKGTDNRRSGDTA